MNIFGLLFLLITQLITGRGLIELFKLQMRPILVFCCSMLCGVALFSFLPFILELFHVAITFSSVTIAIVVTTVIFLVPIILNFRNIKLPDLKSIKLPPIYEYPFWIVFGLLLFVSVWRCYYYPPNARDMLSGPEVMADFAIKEHHIINSVFQIDLQSTNNYLKPPYIIGLQIIYKLFVQQIGQLWLSVITLCFTAMIFTLLKEKLHFVIVGFIMLYFFCMPEVYAYSYLMLFDYSNMVYFFGGFYFLNRYFESRKANELYFSIFMFSIATYVRTETLILVGMLIPLIAYHQFKDKLPVVKSALRIAMLLIFPFIVYFLCMNVYVKHFIPVHYDVTGDVNKNLGDVSYFFNRLTDMSSKLIFSEAGLMYYGYYPHLFLIIILADIIFFRKFSTEAITMLYGIALVYIGLAFIGYLLPLADLMHTTKRGLFKMFPLILLYYRNSGLLQKLTGVINNWELGKPGDTTPKPKPQPVKATAGAPAAKPAPATAGAGKRK